MSGGEAAARIVDSHENVESPASLRPSWKRALARVGLAIPLALAPAAVLASLHPVPRLDADPPVVLVLPTSWRSEAEPVLLRARIVDATGVARVTAWVMGAEDQDYRPIAMTRAANGDYVADLAPWQGRGAAIVYYVEAYDHLGNGPRRSGDPGSPFVARIEPEQATPVPRAAGASGRIALGLLLAPLALLWLMYRQELNRREEAFWVGLLRPVAGKRGTDLVRALDELATRTHRHPHRGETRVARSELRRWLVELRSSGLDAS